jgi:hypothetical protein
MADVLCAAPTCRQPRHQDGCVEGRCAPHPPWPAADGMRLCVRHTDAIATDAQSAAALYDELGVALTTPERPGERVSGTGAARGAINERAVDARGTIRATLVAWCRLVSEERGVVLPTDTVPAMGAYLNVHGQWLAAHPAAGECSDELRELAHGEPWRVAYPSGTRVMVIAPCPVEGCDGMVKAIVRPADHLLPSELRCDADTDHAWPASRWHAFQRAVTKAAA